MHVINYFLIRTQACHFGMLANLAMAYKLFLQNLSLVLVNRFCGL
jgi:hypothetical protein